jgi:antitoxin CcdA
MKHSPKKAARKRPVNLTLSEDLVAEAKGITSNLSGVVESLLIDFVTKARESRLGVVAEARATVVLWNEFAERNGSFADEHSTLWWHSSTSIETAASRETPSPMS